MITLRDLHQKLASSLTSHHSELNSPYQRLLQLLRDNGDQPLDALSDVIEKAFKKSKASNTRTKKPPAFPKSELVARYASDLKNARDAVRLAKVLTQMTADRALAVADIKAIANAYRGTASAYKTKAEAIAAIRKRHLANEADIRKATQIKEMF